MTKFKKTLKNQTEEERMVAENYKKYKVPGGTKITKLKRNVIYINNTNTITHELGKSLGAIMLHRFGDIKFNKEIVQLIKKIDERVSKMDFSSNQTDFVTEAATLDNSRRVDLVNLANNDKYEFECSNRRKKGCITISLDEEK